MIIFANKRRTGKTTNALMIAAATGSILIVPNRNVQKMVESQSREMGYNVPVMAAQDYFKQNPYNRRRKNEKVVIDELEWTLNELFHCDVIAATANGFTNELEIQEPPKIQYVIHGRGNNK